MPSRAVVWFRRDLRLADHPALAAALADADQIVGMFVFDDALLHGRWPAPNRVWFLRESVAELAASFRALGGAFVIARGRASDAVPRLVTELDATAIYLTRDGTPYGRARDRAVAASLAARGVVTHAKRGLYVHEPDELATEDGRAFRVYGPFRRAWERRERRGRIPAPSRIPWLRDDELPEAARLAVPTLAELGVPGPTAREELLPTPGERAARARLDAWLDGPIGSYAEQRDRLDLEGTSRLSQDLRFGLLSPLEVVERADGRGAGRRVFTNELVWREFYAHVLWHHPRVLAEPFQPAYAALPWRDDPDGLEAWKAGRTGYPVVDAAMRQLRESGFVHNRGRMLVASFLAKDLLIDWRAGERHFMEHLTDGDAASNDGGWQWAASTGADAQPPFRIFNPTLQGTRHDPLGDYVRRWVPELARVPTAFIHEPWTMPPDVAATAGVVIGRDYPAPIVDHRAARERALAAYAAAREERAAGATGWREVGGVTRRG